MAAQRGLLLLLLFWLCACGEQNRFTQASHSVAAPSLGKPSELTLTVWQAQQMQLNRALDKAGELNTAVTAMLKVPSAANMLACNNLWQALRDQLEPLAINLELSQLQTGTAWQALDVITQRLLQWPINLGYLDNNGTHGNTGLVFDLDTPITHQTLRQQHQLTSAEDATLGLHALGRLLEGHGKRTVRDWQKSTQLSDEQRSQGYVSTVELPAMRRRQLLALQSEQLVADLKAWHSLWSERDNRSLINAIGQASADQQTTLLLTAAQNFAARQLSSITQQQNTLSAQFRTEIAARQQGLTNWLELLSSGAALQKSRELQRLLARDNTELKELTITAAALTVEIKQSISKIAPKLTN